MITLEQIEQLPVVIAYVGEVKSPWSEDNKNVDQWAVKFTDANGCHAINYYTGLGCSTPAPRPLGNGRKPTKPKIADVLNCLLLDSSALGQNFADWCSDLGYSDDSMKALNIYKACIANGHALNRYLGRDVVAQLRIALEDY